MTPVTLTLALGLPLMVLLRVPLAFALGLVTIGAFWIAGIDPMIFAQRMVSGTQSFSLLAIPFFILAGDLMTAGGISRRLVGFADVLVRHRTGGLGMVAVLAAAFFAALSGSAPATTAAIGTIMSPEMEKRGYSRPFATALAVAGGIIGPMLPPSIPMVVWGVMSETSISQLFLAGIVPGLLLAAGLMALSWNHARRNGIATQPKATRAEVWQALNAAKWALTGPIIVLGGIYGGIVTPTEAAIVAAVFALILGFGLYRELTLTNIVPVTQNSLKTMTMVMFFIALANGFGWMIAFERIPMQAKRVFTMQVTDYVSGFVLPRLADRLQREAPGISFDILPFSITTASVWDQVDLQIRLTPGRLKPEMVRSQRLIADDIVVLMRPDHPDAGKPMTAQLYADLPHVKLSQSATGTTVIDDVLAARGLRRHMAMTVSSWFDIPDIVASSDLIAIAPSRLLHLDPRLRRLQSAPLPLEEVVFSFDLCWDLRTEREPGQRWLRKIVSDIFKQLDADAVSLQSHDPARSSA